MSASAAVTAAGIPTLSISIRAPAVPVRLVVPLPLTVAYMPADHCVDFTCEMLLILRTLGRQMPVLSQVGGTFLSPDSRSPANSLNSRGKEGPQPLTEHR